MREPLPYALTAPTKTLVRTVLDRRTETDAVGIPPTLSAAAVISVQEPYSSGRRWAVG